MNMSKYPILPNSELLPSKMAKLQGLENYLLWRHTYVIEVLNLEIYNFLFETFASIYPSLPNFYFLSWKVSKLQGLPCFPLWYHYDAIKAWNLKINNIFEENRSKGASSLNFDFIHWETSKLQGLCKLPIMTSYWWRERSFEFMKTNWRLMTFLKKTRQSISCYQIWAFYIEKDPSYKAFVKFLLWRHNDVITAFNLRINVVF